MQIIWLSFVKYAHVYVRSIAHVKNCTFLRAIVQNVCKHINITTQMHHSFSHHIFLPSSLSHLPTLLFLPPLVHLLFLSWQILSTPSSLHFKHYGSKPLAVPKGVLKIKTSWKFFPSAPEPFSNLYENICTSPQFENYSRELPETFLVHDFSHNTGNLS